MSHKVFLITIMLLLSVMTYSQESFKKSLEAISTDLCSKMAEKGKKKVVVLFVTDINKAQTTAGKYMADVVSFYIVNNQSGFSVFDRENLSGIAEAKKLIAEGYIDANNAKQLGKILSVEAIVVGNYTVLSKSISLTLKALDVNNGFVIAQSMEDLPIDNDAGTLLGISVGAGNNNSNKGFNNIPLNSNENYNNPETVNKDCETKNTGDYCFTNNTDKAKFATLFIEGKGTLGEIVIDPGQTQCYYDIAATTYKYVICSKRWSWYMSDAEMNGIIKVEKCKSKSFVIKKR